MATQTVTVQELTQFGDNAGGQAFGKLVEVRVLENLKMAGIGSFYTAKAERVDGSSAMYRRVAMADVQNYVRGSLTSQTVETEFQVIQIDQRKSIKHEFETLDVSALGATELGAELVNKAITSMTESAIAFLDVVVLNTAIGALKQANTIVDAKFGTAAATDAELKTSWGNVMTNSFSVETGIDDYNIGTDRSRIITFMNSLSKGFLAAHLKGGNMSSEAQMTGNISMIGGYQIGTHNFIGKNIPAKGAFTSEKTANANWGDFSNIKAITWHSTAIALPINHFKVVMREVNESGNPEYVLKFQYGAGVLRPELIRGIVGTQLPSLMTTKTATTVEPTATKVATK